MPPRYTKNGGTSRGKTVFRPDPDKFLFNIDTLWLNIESYFYDDIMLAGLRDLLIEGREHKSDFGEQLSFELKIPEYENPLVFEIHHGEPPLYQYSIRNESMAIYFSKNYRETHAPMRLDIGQFLLWDKGVENAYNEGLSVLKALGFVPSLAKLNRVDFAVHSDQYYWNYEDIKKLSYPVNFAKDNYPNPIKLNPFTLDFETVYHGDRSRCFLRIYNKSLEIEKKRKYYFYEIYQKKLMDTTNVWNVEIEVRRPFLKELKENVEDHYLAIFDDFDYCLKVNGLSRLWTLLMERYSHDSPFWRVLEKGDKNHFNQIEEYNLDISKDIEANWEREVAQIAGRLITGVVNESNYSLDNALRKFREKVLDLEMQGKRKYWHDLVEEKKAKIHSQTINRQIKKPTPGQDQK